MAPLAQLILFCDQHGLRLLVVVSGMASQAGETSLGVLLARIDFVAGSANSLNRFWPRVCEPADLVRIPRLGMRCARPMASFAAWLRQLFFLQGLDMRRLGEAFVLILVAALADLGAGILGGVVLAGRFRRALAQRWETSDRDQNHYRKQAAIQSMTG